MGAVHPYERHCARATFHLLDTGVRFTVRRERPLVAMTMRDRLDHLLAASAARAGAELVAPCQVRNVAPEAQTVRLDTDRGPFNHIALRNEILPELQLGRAPGCCTTIPGSAR